MTSDVSEVEEGGSSSSPRSLPPLLLLFSPSVSFCSRPLPFPLRRETLRHHMKEKMRGICREGGGGGLGELQGVGTIKVEVRKRERVMKGEKGGAVRKM